MIKTWSWILAVVFLAVGILGFIPAFAPNGMLLGLFEVDALHNIIHLISGLAFVWAALAAETTGRMVFKVFGIIYAIVAVVGLVQGDTVLGIIAANMADHILHVVLAVVILYIGFGKGGSHASMPMETPPSNPPTV
ncbi:MAG: DUF4383 domain-containing protein [Candidatus Paceibacteria bacterium]